MLGYRHGYHAGNHADVLKHVTLVALLRHMAAKEKGFRVVDTHAGAGGYSLEGAMAREFGSGIGRIWGRDADAPPAVADYLQRVRDFNADATLRQYPGSPAFAQLLLRPQDQLRAFELHPTDHKILASFIGGTHGCEVAMRDGFESLRSQLPPPTRRGLVVVDPSYEIKTDYVRVLGALRETLTRFAEAVVLVWLPRLRLLDAVQLPQRLKASADKQAKRGWLLATLTVANSDARGFGMVGSSVFVANPPHTLRATLQPALPWLADALGSGAAAEHRIETAGG